MVLRLRETGILLCVQLGIAFISDLKIWIFFRVLMSNVMDFSLGTRKKREKCNKSDPKPSDKLLQTTDKV